MWLSQAGVYHYKARAYEPNLGRFLQTDPVGYDAGLNLYAYVANDPVNMTDPTGLWPQSEEGGGVTECIENPNSCQFPTTEVEDVEVVGRFQRVADYVGNRMDAFGRWTRGAAAEIGGCMLDVECSVAVLGPVGEINALRATTMGVTELSAVRAGILREAARGVGQFTIAGSVSVAEANLLGRSFVGPGARSIQGGKGLLSADGLRVFRFPTSKRYGGTVANFESRATTAQGFTNNGHLRIN